MVRNSKYGIGIHVGTIVKITGSAVPGFGHVYNFGKCRTQAVVRARCTTKTLCLLYIPRPSSPPQVMLHLPLSYSLSSMDIEIFRDGLGFIKLGMCVEEEKEKGGKILAKRNGTMCVSQREQS